MHTAAAQITIAHARHARGFGLSKRRRRVPASKPPLLIESDYAAELVQMIEPVRRAVAMHVRMDDDKAARRVRLSTERARHAVLNGPYGLRLEGMVTRAARQVADRQRQEFRAQAEAALGVDVHTFDPNIGDIIDGFVAENVTLIKTLQGAAIDEVSRIITRGFADGKRAAELGAEIQARYEIAERHARLIARDQIGKLNGRVTEARHREVGITSYVWNSMRDRRVRRLHALLDGKACDYNDPPYKGNRDGGNPGQAICCRCTATPSFEALLAAFD